MADSLCMAHTFAEDDEDDGKRKSEGEGPRERPEEKPAKGGHGLGGGEHEETQNSG